MDWIDTHVHIGTDRDGTTAEVNDVVTLLSEAGIDRAVVFCLNEPRGIEWGNSMIRRIVQEHDQLSGLFRIDPAVHEPDDLRRADDFAGFKLHPRAQEAAMQHVYDHLAVAGELDKPVLSHTDAWGRYSHPLTVVEAAAAHPETTIIAAHMFHGFYFQASPDIRERIMAQENLLVDTSLYSTPAGIEKLVTDLGPDRIVFGSDYPYGHPSPIQKSIALARIDKSATAAIAAGNADRLFR